MSPAIRWLTRAGESRRPGDREEEKLGQRADELRPEVEEGGELRHPRAAGPLGDELGEADALEDAEGIGGDEHELEVLLGVGGGEVDENPIGAGAGHAADPPNLARIDGAEVNDDAGPGAPAAGGHLWNEGDLGRHPQVARSGEVAEKGPGPAGEDGGEPVLLERPRPRSGCVDAAVETVQAT